MKRTALFLAISIAALSVLSAQGSMRTPPEPAEDDAVSEHNGAYVDAELAKNLEGECTLWAKEKFDSFTQDKDMCDVGTALYQDTLRSEAMRDRPDWPIWAVDLALDEVRDSYLRAMLFSE